MWTRQDGRVADGICDRRIRTVALSLTSSNLRTSDGTRAGFSANPHETHMARLVRFHRRRSTRMIDGLKLTLSGDELRTLLDARIEHHEQKADWWTHEQTRTDDEATEDEPQLPAHMCEHEAERHAWRSRVLAFIRDHVDATETYRLDAAALEFGELLPEMPGSVAQEKYEERTAVGFNLERLTKKVDGLTGMAYGWLSRHTSQPADQALTRGEAIEETDEFTTTRLDVDDGPEMIMIERK